MPTRGTPESKVIEYFESAALAVARTMVNVVRGLVARRSEEERPRARAPRPAAGARPARVRSRPKPAAAKGTTGSAHVPAPPVVAAHVAAQHIPNG